MNKVLILEDDECLRKGLEISLRRHGYEIASGGSGGDALELVESSHPDLILLDVGLPEMDGFEICRRLRRQGWVMPIIFITVRDEEIDRVVGLELGADDYVVKPFCERELIARIGACLRRVNRSSMITGYRFDDVDVDFAQRTVRRAGRPVRLTDKEFRLLMYLIQRRGEVVTRDELLDRIWGYDTYPVTRTVDTHILSLRRKLDRTPPEPQHIRSVHGEGYRFD